MSELIKQFEDGSVLEFARQDTTTIEFGFTEKEVRTVAAALQLALVRYGFLLQAVNAGEDELLSHDEVRVLRNRLRSELAAHV